MIDIFRFFSSQGTMYLMVNFTNKTQLYFKFEGEGCKKYIDKFDNGLREFRLPRHIFFDIPLPADCCLQKSDNNSILDLIFLKIY